MVADMTTEQTPQPMTALQHSATLLAASFARGDNIPAIAKEAVDLAEAIQAECERREKQV